MRYVIVVAAAMLITMASAEAKCLKGKRIIDGLNPYECALLQGDWVDARRWRHSLATDKVVTRPRVRRGQSNDGHGHCFDNRGMPESCR